MRIIVLLFYISLINSKCKKNGFVYKAAFNQVQAILSKFQTIVSEMSSNYEPKISTADEIKKFKELLDIGAISQEELETKNNNF